MASAASSPGRREEPLKTFTCFMVWPEAELAPEIFFFSKRMQELRGVALPVHLQIKFSTQSRATVVCGEARVSPAAPNPFLPPSVFCGLAVAWLGVRIFFLSSSTVTGVPEPENSSLSTGKSWTLSLHFSHIPTLSFGALTAACRVFSPAPHK